MGPLPTEPAGISQAGKWVSKQGLAQNRGSIHVSFPCFCHKCGVGTEINCRRSPKEMGRRRLGEQLGLVGGWWAVWCEHEGFGVLSVYLHNHSIFLPWEAQNQEGSCWQAGVGLGNGLTSVDLARLPSAAASSAQCWSDSQDSRCFLATALFGGTLSAKGEAGLEVCARQAAPLINSQGPPSRSAPSRQLLPPRAMGARLEALHEASSYLTGFQAASRPKSLQRGPGHPCGPQAKPSCHLLYF